MASCKPQLVWMMDAHSAGFSQFAGESFGE